jgi:translation initiation factor IF-2
MLPTHIFAPGVQVPTQAPAAQVLLQTAPDCQTPFASQVCGVEPMQRRSPVMQLLATASTAPPSGAPLSFPAAASGLDEPPAPVARPAPPPVPEAVPPVPEPLPLPPAARPPAPADPTAPAPPPSAPSCTLIDPQAAIPMTGRSSAAYRTPDGLYISKRPHRLPAHRLAGPRSE